MPSGKECFLTGDVLIKMKNGSVIEDKKSI